MIPTFHYSEDKLTLLSASDFPCGFAYLASSLKQAGHEVYGCNPNNHLGYQSLRLMLEDKLVSKLREVQPGLVGLGGLCTDYAFLKDAINFIRNTDEKIPIVLGGQIVTNDAKDIFEILRPDFAIVGEGEEAIVKLADTIQSGERDYESIDNLGYWREE